MIHGLSIPWSSGAHHETRPELKGACVRRVYQRGRRDGPVTSPSRRALAASDAWEGTGGEDHLHRHLEVLRDPQREVTVRARPRSPVPSLGRGAASRIASGLCTRGLSAGRLVGRRTGLDALVLGGEAGDPHGCAVRNGQPRWTTPLSG